MLQYCNHCVSEEQWTREVVVYDSGLEGRELSSVSPRKWVPGRQEGKKSFGQGEKVGGCM